MKKNEIIIILFSLFIFFSCSKDEITELPESIIIRTVGKDIAKKRIDLIATQTNGNQTGRWSVISNNQTIGSFESVTNSVTSFTGSLLEIYEIKWEVNNGRSSISDNISVLMLEGESLKEVVRIERNVKKLVNLYLVNKLSLKALINVGITFKELNNEGVSLEVLLNNFSALELYENGFTIREMLDTGFGLNLLFGSIQNLDYFLNENISLIDLINADISLQSLFNGGASVEALINANVPLKNLIGIEKNNNGNHPPIVDTFDFINLNISKQTLIDEGIIVETETTGLYIMNYLFQFEGGFNSFKALINEKYSYPNSEWKIPSIDTLKSILNNNSQLDMKHELTRYDLYTTSDSTSCYHGFDIWSYPPIYLNYKNFQTVTDCYVASGILNSNILPIIQL